MAREILPFDAHFDRLGEIQKTFYHAIQAVDFAIQYVDRLLRGNFIPRRQVFFQIFQPQAH